jgi:hypothetical protein
VSKAQFDEMFDAKVVILWQGILQYNASEHKELWQIF